MEKINIKVAAPTDGEGIEYLNLANFADSIHTELSAQFPDYEVSVEAFEHEGTGRDSIDAPADVYDQVSEALTEAVSSAFSDTQNYDAPDLE